MNDDAMCSDDDDGAGETAKVEKVLKIVKGRLTARGLTRRVDGSHG